MLSKKIGLDFMIVIRQSRLDKNALDCCKRICHTVLELLLSNASELASEETIATINLVVVMPSFSIATDRVDNHSTVFMNENFLTLSLIRID